MNNLKPIGKVTNDNIKVGTTVYDNAVKGFYEVYWHDKDTRGALLAAGLSSVKHGHNPLSPVWTVDGDELMNQKYNDNFRYIVWG
mgnify:FL=1